MTEKGHGRNDPRQPAAKSCLLLRTRFCCPQRCRRSYLKYLKHSNFEPQWSDITQCPAGEDHIAFYCAHAAAAQFAPLQVMKSCLVSRTVILAASYVLRMCKPCKGNITLPLSSLRPFIHHIHNILGISGTFLRCFRLFSQCFFGLTSPPHCADVI